MFQWFCRSPSIRLVISLNRYKPIFFVILKKVVTRSIYISYIYLSIKQSNHSIFLITSMTYSFYNFNFKKLLYMGVTSGGHRGSRGGRCNSSIFKAQCNFLWKFSRRNVNFPASYPFMLPPLGVPLTRMVNMILFAIRL